MEPSLKIVNEIPPDKVVVILVVVIVTSAFFSFLGVFFGLADY